MKHLWQTRRLYFYENSSAEQRRATWLELFYDLVFVGLWLVPIMVPVPWRFVLWALELIVDFATPFFVRKLTLQALPSISHIPERLGLLVIIVLGESMVAVVRGVVNYLP